MTPTLPEFDLETYLPFRLTVIAGHLSAALAKQYKDRFGISIPEWRVLLNVGYSSELSIRDIEKRVNLEKSKISRAASRLEAKGYLVKYVDDGDRRLLKMTLTTAGVELLQELIPIAQRFQDALEAQLDGRVDDLNAALDCLAATDGL